MRAIDSSRERANCRDGHLEGSLVPGIDIDEASIGLVALLVAGVVGTIIRPALVRVIDFGLEVIVDHELEGHGGATTAAAQVSVVRRAIDEVLGTQGGQDAGFLEVLGFQCTRLRKFTRKFSNCFLI